MAETGNLTKRKGRPKGAVNKKTKDFNAKIERFGEFYADPLEVLFGVAAGKLSGVDPGELTPQLRIDAAKALMPYIYTRKPVEVSHEAKGQVSFKMVLPGIDTGDNAQVIEHQDE